MDSKNAVHILYNFMGKACGFNDYLLLREGNTRTALKSLLYPLGYGGLGNYPPAHYIPQAADAVLYISKDDRLWCNGDHSPWNITHLPGHKQYGDTINNGDSEPWNIKDMPGKSIEPDDHDLPGKEIPYKGFVKLVTAIKCISPKGINLPE
jgi:hypothetical protein